MYVLRMKILIEIRIIFYAANSICCENTSKKLAKKCQIISTLENFPSAFFSSYSTYTVSYKRYS